MVTRFKSIPLLDSELNDYILSNSHFFERGMVTYPDVGHVCLPTDFTDIEEQILDFEVRPDDVWIITFPKCGTTWTQEMIWLLMNNLDYEGSRKGLYERSPFLEFAGMGSLIKFSPIKGDYLDTLNKAKSPRVIKTHLPLPLTPRQLWDVKPKIVYVLRNPLDGILSSLNHYRILNGYRGTPEKFYEAYMSNVLSYGSYFEHVAGYRKYRGEPNFLFNTFEEMKNDLGAVIRRTAAFLGKSLTLDQLEKLENHLSFESMRSNESVNFKPRTQKLRVIHGGGGAKDFMNRGEVGAYKKVLSAEWTHRFEAWLQENKVKHNLMDTDFPY